MAETENKKPMSPQEAFAWVAALGALLVARKIAFIEFWAIQDADGLMFAAWLGILALVYVRLKKAHPEMARERKQLLRLKALEHRDGGSSPDDDGGGSGGPGKPGPGPLTSSEHPSFAQSSRTQEIDVGTRMSDGRAIRLSDQRRLGQVQIPGATGRGKTESVILPWMVQDYARGKPVLLIDGKGDPDLVKRFCDTLRITSRSEGVFVFDPMDPRSCVINPLGSGSAQQITDRILASFQFPDLYYKNVQADALLTVTHLLKEQAKEVTFTGIYRALTDMDHLSELSNASKDPGAQGGARALIRQKEETRGQNLSGILSQLAPFTRGEIGKLVNGCSEPGQKYISLLDALVTNAGKRSATLILLPTLVYQDVGRILGRMILQELAYCVGMRAAGTGRRYAFTPVFLDEFSSFAYSGFEQILNKARSSGVALHLSHQSMGDLESVSPQFAKIVNTNTNVKCLLGLNDPDTAEFFARHLGTYTTEKFTERTEEREGFFSTNDERTGMKSVRETEAYKVHPNILKGMSAGQGVLHVPTEQGPMTEEVQFHSLWDCTWGGSADEERCHSPGAGF
jgi:hypothetical protein